MRCLQIIRLAAQLHNTGDNGNAATMTQYVEILYSALALNVFAVAYRCRWLHHLAALLRRFTPSGTTSTSTQQPQDSLDLAHTDGIPGSDTDMAKRQRTLLYSYYLPVYLLATCADWLQGPYKYAVYSAYGYSQHDISILFVAGFGSGMTLGSIVGGLADTWGRKRMALMYCACYMLSCLAKHCRPFVILLLGRVLGGIATSLLFSVFDAWLIKATAIRRIDKSYLSESFSAANFGSSVVAIVSGLVANWLVGSSAEGGIKSTLRPAFQEAARKWIVEEAESSKHGGDLLGPPTTVDDKRWDAAWVYVGGGIKAFDLALIPLACCFLFCLASWDENYGEEDCQDKSDEALANGRPSSANNKTRKRRIGVGTSIWGASRTVWRSPGIFNLCAVSTLSESQLYIFILFWTPALRAIDTHPEIDGYPGPPLGIVFASFMVSCMLGTSLFAILTARGMRTSLLLVFVLLLSAISCLTIAKTKNDTTSYLAMLAFEAAIGAYYPAMSTVKSAIVPEDQRAAIYSVFRLPLNLMVLLNLVSNLEIEQSFGICAAMLGLATLLQCRAVLWEGRSSSATATATAQSLKKNEMRPLLKTKDSTVGDYNDCSDESHAIDVDISSSKDGGTTIKRHQKAAFLDS